MAVKVFECEIAAVAWPWCSFFFAEMFKSFVL